MRHILILLAALAALSAPGAAGQGITVRTDRPGHAISPTLYNGMLFEEINHGVDGGFYAELLRSGVGGGARVELAKLLFGADDPHFLELVRK